MQRSLRVYDECISTIGFMNPLLPLKRVLLKISGECLQGSEAFGIQKEACLAVAHSIKSLQEAGIEVGIVIGGGNIFRGLQLKEAGMKATPADQMGMLATMINGLALQQALAQIECPARVLSAIDCPKIVESYTWTHALNYLDKGEVLIFVGGTGNPYFTTDTAAAMRASEIQADILLKATKVDGIYTKDPLKYNDAVKYNCVSYSQFLAEKLGVMDATAITLCRNNKIPVFVFNMKHLANDIVKILKTREMKLGSLIQGD